MTDALLALLERLANKAVDGVVFLTRAEVNEIKRRAAANSADHHHLERLFGHLIDFPMLPAANVVTPPGLHKWRNQPAEVGRAKARGSHLSENS